MQTINLTFHGLGDIDRDLDPGEADVWVSRERYLSLLDAVQDRDDVRITFDDGNLSDLEIGLPALRARGLSATFFVVAGRLGTPGFLDADGVRELQAAGMTIGCHGMRHRPWRRLAGHDLHEELVEAKRKLEDVVERPVTEAACPFGSYDRRVLRSLAPRGIPPRLHERPRPGPSARLDAVPQQRARGRRRLLARRNPCGPGRSAGAQPPRPAVGQALALTRILRKLSAD